jgi:hypothetical protein
LKTLRGLFYGGHHEGSRYGGHVHRIEVLRGCFFVGLFAAKKRFLNMVLGSLAGAVLGFVSCLLCSLGVSVFVWVFVGKASVLAAVVMFVCGGFGGTER